MPFSTISLRSNSCPTNIVVSENGLKPFSVTQHGYEAGVGRHSDHFTLHDNDYDFDISILLIYLM